MKTLYWIETHHPIMPSLCGWHEAEVTENPNGTRYVNSSEFGCSRDYVTDSDRTAIEMLLREHGCKLVDYGPLVLSPSYKL